ncbi:MAG: sugar phosphate isomerase/epimerase family protein, partial [Halanaerobiales bacterium]
MKISVNTYSFSDLINAGEMTQIEAIEKAAEMGFDEIEFSGLEIQEGETPLSMAKIIRKKCEKTGIGIANYAIGADFLQGSNGDLKAEIERLKKEVEVAAALGTNKMRHDASRGFPDNYQGLKSFDKALPALIKGCKAVTKYAADYGIKTMIENHGFFCQESRLVEKVVNGVNHPNFGVLIDIGNFLCVDEEPIEAITRLMPYAFF